MFPTLLSLYLTVAPFLIWKKLLQSLGCDPKLYGEHSGKRGGATAAAVHGTTEIQLKRLGGWCSRMRLWYINFSPTESYWFESYVLADKSRQSPMKWMKSPMNVEMRQCQLFPCSKSLKKSFAFSIAIRSKHFYCKDWISDCSFRMFHRIFASNPGLLFLNRHLLTWCVGRRVKGGSVLFSN